MKPHQKRQRSHSQSGDRKSREMHPWIVAVGLGMVGGLQAPVPEAVSCRSHAAVRMQADNLNLDDLFNDKPPPSWGSPEWRWGYADGAAHEVTL